MALRVQCPSCGFVGQVPDQHRGRVISCPKCKNQFAANPAGPPASQGVTAPAPRPAASPPKTGTRPAPRRKSMVPLLAALGAFLLLAGAGAAGGVWWWLNRDGDAPKKDRSVAAADETPRERSSAPESAPATRNEDPKKEDLKKEDPKKEDPKKEDPKKEDLPVGGTDTIPVATLKAIKEATVFVRVQAGAMQSSGSGFLMQADGEAGYVVTNQHVVVPPPEVKFTGKPAVTLVFRSGTDRNSRSRARSSPPTPPATWPWSSSARSRTCRSLSTSSPRRS